MVDIYISFIILTNIGKVIGSSPIYGATPVAKIYLMHMLQYLWFAMQGLIKYKKKHVSQLSSIIRLHYFMKTHMKGVSLSLTKMSNLRLDTIPLSRGQQCIHLGYWGH